VVFPGRLGSTTLPRLLHDTPHDAIASLEHAVALAEDGWVGQFRPGVGPAVPGRSTAAELAATGITAARWRSPVHIQKILDSEGHGHTLRLAALTVAR
jgi:hypothetical protein